MQVSKCKSRKQKQNQPRNFPQEESLKIFETFRDLLFNLQILDFQPFLFPFQNPKRDFALRREGRVLIINPDNDSQRPRSVRAYKRLQHEDIIHIK